MAGKQRQAARVVGWGVWFRETGKGDRASAGVLHSVLVQVSDRRKEPGALLLLLDKLKVF